MLSNPINDEFDKGAGTLFSDLILLTCILILVRCSFGNVSLVLLSKIN